MEKEHKDLASQYISGFDKQILFGNQGQWHIQVCIQRWYQDLESDLNVIRIWTFNQYLKDYFNPWNWIKDEESEICDWLTLWSNLLCYLLALTDFE